MAALALIAAPSLAAASSSIPSRQLEAVHETVVDKHISDLMPLFLADELNQEWNHRLASQRIVPPLSRRETHSVYQTYNLPWPLLPRDLLVNCKRDIDKRGAHVIQTCHSLEHPDAPITPSHVRLLITRSTFELYSLPGDKTRLRLSLQIPQHAAKGMPKWIVDFVQCTSLRDTTTTFLAAIDRLQLPPHPSYVGWRRKGRKWDGFGGASFASSLELEAGGISWWGCVFATLLALSVARGGLNARSWRIRLRLLAPGAGVKRMLILVGLPL